MLRVTPGNRLRLAVVAQKRDNYTARSLLKLAVFFCVCFFLGWRFPLSHQTNSSKAQTHVTASLAPVQSRKTSSSKVMSGKHEK